MKNIKKICIFALICMTIFAFTNLFGMNISGISVLLGIAFFFINQVFEKQFTGSGLDFKAIGMNLKEKRIWIWITLPTLMNAVVVFLSKLILPDFIEHVLARTQTILSFDKFFILILQLAIFALGEEIAWRAFFQKQLNRALPIVPAILITSVLFSIGHIANGRLDIVVFDIFFVFINSILYGIVFHKTGNAWISAISHFIANLFSVIVIVLFLV